MLAIIAASISWIVLRLVVAVLRGAASVGRRLLGGGGKHPAAAAKRTAPEAATPTMARPSQQQQQQQTPGVSLKHLVKSAAKARGGGAAAGPDRHAQQLFIAGLRGHGDAVTGLAFSADGTALATACDDRTVRLFDVRWAVCGCVWMCVGGGGGGGGGGAAAGCCCSSESR